MKILFFDTETTGLPLWKEPSDHPDQPHIVDIAVDLFCTEAGEVVATYDTIINCGAPIPPELTELHGIDAAMMEAEGVPPDVAFVNFKVMVDEADLIVGHNVSFDIRMVRILAARVTGEKWDNQLPTFCTMRKATPLCGLKTDSGRPKFPNLSEAYRHFFGEEFENAHRARPDTDAARRIYFAIQEQGQ